MLKHYMQFLKNIILFHSKKKTNSEIFKKKKKLNFPFRSVIF